MSDEADDDFEQLDDVLRAVADGTGGQAATKEESGQFLGPYELLGEIGAGGVARVLRARHIHPTYANQLYAVKLLHATLGHDEKIVPLFRREAYILALLQHPNIVTTYEAGIQDNQLFIAMEYIAGVDMDNLLRRCRQQQITIPLPLSLFLVVEVLQALAFAHELTDDGKPLRLIHRDVNPANVFVSFDGQVKLGDFGVAGLMAEHRSGKSELIGKLGYFAPEQLHGGGIDQRADVYAVGVMLFETLFQRPLFTGDSQEALLRANKKAFVPSIQQLSPAIPAHLEAIVRKALQPKAQDRYATARAMLEELLPVLGEKDSCALGLASLMRRVCLAEYQRALALSVEQSAQLQNRPYPGQVMVMLPDVNAQQAFVQLLLSRGIAAIGGDTLASLQGQLMLAAPQVVLCQVGTGLLPQVRHLIATRPIAIVGVGDEFEQSSWQVAHQAGAVDLLCKPYGMERTLAAVQAAWYGLHQSKKEQAGVEAERLLPLQRCLLLCHDPTIQARWQERMLQASFEVDMFTDPIAALASGRQRIHHLIVLDGNLGEHACLQFVQDYRNLPGVGRLPVLLLQASLQTPWKITQLERASWLDPNTAQEEVDLVWKNLYRDTKEYRSFVRYIGDWPAAMRYSGRILPCQLHDISRGGISLRCQHIPVIGSKVALQWQLPSSQQAIALHGLILRVELIKQEGQDIAQVALRLLGFADQGERDLLAYLATLPKVEETLPPVMVDPTLASKSSSSWQDFWKGWRKEPKI